MLDAIPPQLITGGGLAGIVLFAVVLVLTGRIVARSTLESALAVKDKQITYLERTLQVREEESRVRSDQMQKLLAQSDLTVQLLQSLTREAARGHLEA